MDHEMPLYIILFLNLFVGCYSICSQVYGNEPCSFLPAPPGKTPPCARPGLTYCEHPDHYPGQLIHHLIQKWRFDHATILSDESKEEFSSFYYPPPVPKYGPPPQEGYGLNNNLFQDNSYFPEPIHIPKPHQNFNMYQPTGNTYIPPRIAPAQNFTSGYFDTKPGNQDQVESGQLLTYKYSTNFPQQNQHPYNEYYYQLPNVYTGHIPANQYNNNIWKRKLFDNKHVRLRRSLRKKLLRKREILLNGNVTFANGTIHQRSKRQNNLTGEVLCQTRSQYIMPRAALNNKGNWMYVVNMPEVNNRYSQLVKSESCVSQTCSGLCVLPLGYTSRCEQKYVQKRLVALEGGGNQLYTDVFWFPSCCVCTLSNN